MWVVIVEHTPYVVGLGALVIGVVGGFLRTRRQRQLAEAATLRKLDEIERKRAFGLVDWDVEFKKLYEEHDDQKQSQSTCR